jgi:hypothetical protein
MARSTISAAAIVIRNTVDPERRNAGRRSSRQLDECRDEAGGLGSRGFERVRDPAERTRGSMAIAAR